MGEGSVAAARGVVWLVAADHWPRAALRAELMERGFDVIGFPSMDAAILRLAFERQRRPHLFVIDLRGQDLSGGRLRLLSAGSIPMLGIAGLGDASAEPAKWAWTEMVRRPVSLGEIADRVDRLFAAGRAG